MDNVIQGEGNEHIAALYERLRHMAGRYFRGASPAATLQPTALVHEAWLKLASAERELWKDREHFCALAANAMRQVLADQARRRRAQKRAPGGERITLSAVGSGTTSDAVDLVALDDALTELAELDPRQAKLVELRFFAGLSAPEASKVLGVSLSTAEADWRRARAWMSRAIEGLSSS